MFARLIAQKYEIPYLTYRGSTYLFIDDKELMKKTEGLFKYYKVIPGFNDAFQRHYLRVVH